MDLPDNVTNSTNFVQGFAFRKWHSSTGEGEKYRYFFILNKNPNEDDVLILSTVTTQIKKHVRRFPPEVLVKITPKEYPPLPKVSLINCEQARACLKSEVQGWIDKGKLKYLDPLPSVIVAKISKAVSHCKILADEDKRRILGEDP